MEEESIIKKCFHGKHMFSVWDSQGISSINVLQPFPGLIHTHTHTHKYRRLLINNLTPKNTAAGLSSVHTCTHTHMISSCFKDLQNLNKQAGSQLILT